MGLVLATGRLQPLAATPLARVWTFLRHGRVAGWSPGHLIAVFRSVTGHSSYRFLLARRLDEACRLLDAGELTVTEICWRTGFGSLSHFLTSFRRETGLSPARYRRRPGARRTP